MAGLLVANTYLYPEDWSTTLQARLNKLTVWKDVCLVEYTNTKVFYNPYTADITLQTPTRGSSYTYQNVVVTTDSNNINQVAIAPVFIDRADLAQSDYAKEMRRAERQAAQLDEQIESAVWGNFVNYDFFDGASIGGSAGSITVSATNVDDIITNVTKLIHTQNGTELYNRNGGFFVWKPADFQKLQTFVMANGFVPADNALKNGIPNGFHYMGFDHYVSNLLPSGRFAAGVKKIIHVGILKDTYGQVMIDDKDPAQLSGVGIVSRVDYGTKVWKKTGSLLFDIATATT